MREAGSFLARWSRLKREARRKPAAAEAAPPPELPPPELPPPELPPIDSLTAESDFAPFMQPGVPEALRNAALQKLWRSDPVFANLDGLVEYGEDFAAEFNAVGAVATAYRVLEGMPDRDETEPPPAPLPDTAEALRPGEEAGGEPGESAADPPAAPAGRPGHDRIS